MKGNFNLVLLRVLAVSIAVITNIFIIKLLSLEEVGKYYILGTIAYFGNALFFVGFDFSLQRKIRNISIDKSINLPSISFFLLKTLPYGSLASFCLSFFVSFAGDATHWFETALLCSALASVNYLASISRNILQIAGEKYRVSQSMLLEQTVKLSLTFLSVLFFGAKSHIVIISFIWASLICFIFNYNRIKKCFNSNIENERYKLELTDLSNTVLPVSAGGVLNWLQLQGYRPVIGQFMQQAELVGAVSFLTMLGSTVASASLGVLAQVWIPRQFATEGKKSRQFVRLSSIIILALALLAYPTAYVFLRLLGKESLFGLEYLVSIGVIVEGGNFLLGVLGNHSSLTRGSFVPSMISGIIGFVTGAIIIFSSSYFHLVGPASIGIALAVSQCVAVLALLPVLNKFSTAR